MDMTTPLPPTRRQTLALAVLRWSLIGMGVLVAVGPPIWSDMTPAFRDYLTSRPTLLVVGAFACWGMLSYFFLHSLADKLTKGRAGAFVFGGLGSELEVLAWYCVHPATRPLFCQWHREGRVLTPLFFNTLKQSIGVFPTKNAQGLDVGNLYELAGRIEQQGRRAMKNVSARRQCKAFLDAVFAMEITCDREHTHLDKALPEACIKTPLKRL
jgi:hypothetical protein